MELCFTDLSVTSGEKTLLADVSGAALPGELLAIMGPSGAGKTTLLNTLSGRLPFKGQITLDGTPLNKALKRKMCYVLQQEAFFANLTLRDTLNFTAMIRLPDSMSYDQKMCVLGSVVEDLDLKECLNVVMGDMFTPGLSGGQKKRASIACELLRDPDLIFLDEPTTGLDSSTTSSLISLLKSYAARSSKTIVASIHQPSSQNFLQFDKLLLLTDGQVAYFGETNKVLDHFEEAGVIIGENVNPADFVLEALADNQEVKDKLLGTSKTNGSVEASLIPPNNEFTVEETENSGILSKLRTKFQRNFPRPRHDSEAQYSDLDPGSVRMSLLDLTADDAQQLDDPDCDDDQKKWPTGFCTQYKQLTIRTFKESRKRILDVTKMFENFLICGFVSLIFYQLPRDESMLRDRMGAVFFIAAHWAFIPLFDAVTSFPMERMVINKERSAGWYRLSAYYLAKMTSEMVLILIQPTVFVIIAYWVIGLNGLEAFFSTLGTVFIDAIAGQSIGLFVGIACLQVNQAMTVSITFQMAIMLLGGLFTRTLPVWLDWMKYLSFLHYSFHSLMVLEFKDAKPVECISPANSSAFLVCRQPNVTSIPSEQILEYYDITWPYWQYIIPLLGFTLVFRILGYVTLRYFRKPF